MRKIEIEIPEGHKEVIKHTENGVVIQWNKVSKEQEMKDFLKPFLTNLLLVKDELNPNSVLYKQNGEIIFKLVKKNEKLIFMADYKKIWEVMRDRFELTNYGVKWFLKSEIEKTFNLVDIDPQPRTLLLNSSCNLQTPLAMAMWFTGKQNIY